MDFLHNSTTVDVMLGEGVREVDGAAGWDWKDEKLHSGEKPLADLNTINRMEAYSILIASSSLIATSEPTAAAATMILPIINWATTDRDMAKLNEWWKNLFPLLFFFLLRLENKLNSGHKDWENFLLSPRSERIHKANHAENLIMFAKIREKKNHRLGSLRDEECSITFPLVSTLPPLIIIFFFRRTQWLINQINYAWH